MFEYFKTKICSTAIKEIIMKHNINNKGDTFELCDCTKGFKYCYCAKHSLKFLDFSIKGVFLQNQDYALLSVDLKINRVLNYFINIVFVVYLIILFINRTFFDGSHKHLIALIGITLLFIPIIYDLTVHSKIKNKFIKKIKQSVPYMEPISKKEYDRLAGESFQ